MKLIFDKKGLIFILAVGFAIRLASVAPIHSAGLTSDEREYVYLAKKVAAGEAFVDSNGEQSKRSPLYPIVLGHFFRFFGEGLWLPQVLGCILGTLVIMLSYKLFTELWPGSQEAILATSAVALYPGMIIYSGLLLTEVLYLVFMLLAFISAFRLSTSDRMADAVMFGVTSGLAALTRAVFLGFFVLLIALLWWQHRREGRKSFKHIAVAAILFCVVLVPWTVRNYVVHGDVIPISSWGGQALLIGNNPYATGTWSLKPGFEEWYSNKAAEHGVAAPAGLPELERRRLDRAIALDYITTHPFHTLQLALKKAHMFWVYPITHSDTYLPTQAASVAFDLLLYVGAAVGLVAAWNERKRLMPILLALVFFAAGQVVLHSEARYRLPLVPFLCIFFGWGAAILTDKARRTEFLSSGKQRTAAGILTACIVLVYCLTGLLFLEGRI